MSNNIQAPTNLTPHLNTIAQRLFNSESIISHVESIVNEEYGESASLKTPEAKVENIRVEQVVYGSSSNESSDGPTQGITAIATVRFNSLFSGGDNLKETVTLSYEEILKLYGDDLFADLVDEDSNEE